MLPLYTLAELYVNNPGNLSDRVRRHRLDELVEEMESLPGAYGRESTRYFLRDYDTYMAAQSELTDDEGDIVDASELPELARFLNSSDNDWWQGFLKWHSDGYDIVPAAFPSVLSEDGPESIGFFPSSVTARGRC